MKYGFELVVFMPGYVGVLIDDDPGDRLPDARTANPGLSRIDEMALIDHDSLDTANKRVRSSRQPTVATKREVIGIPGVCCVD